MPLLRDYEYGPVLLYVGGRLSRQGNVVSDDILVMQKAPVPRKVRGLAFGFGGAYIVGRGHVLRKEDIPMKQFLRDVLAAFVAGLLVAVAVHLMNH